MRVVNKFLKKSLGINLKELILTILMATVSAVIFSFYIIRVAFSRGYFAIGGEWLLPLLIYLIIALKNNLKEIWEEMKDIK